MLLLSLYVFRSSFYLYLFLSSITLKQIETSNVYLNGSILSLAAPDPHLGSWNYLPHQAHIALSEPMSSTDKQGSSLGSFPTFPSPLSPL